jgi:cell division protein FtsQ
MKAAPSALRSRVLPAAAAAAVMALIAGGAWQGYEFVTSQPIKRVLFAGDLKKLARSDLEAFAQSVQGASASNASFAAVREAARRVPWVRDASVRRRFPGAVEVTFETHEALARWGDGSLVSTRGEVFTAEHAGFLPRFKGPEASALEMAREYPALVAAVKPLQSAIVEVRLSARGAWLVVLDSGHSLDLGRGDIHSRLARFVAAWPKLAAQGLPAKHVDLRYGNGFAMARMDPLPREAGKK